MSLRDHCFAKESTDTEVLSNATFTRFICTCRILQTESIYAFRVAVLTNAAVGPNSDAVAAKTRSLSVPPTMPAPTLCGVGLRRVPQGTLTALSLNGDSTHAAHVDMFSLYACVEVSLPMDNGGREIVDVLFRWRRSGKHHTYTHHPFVFHVGTNETKVVNGLGHLAA